MTRNVASQCRSLRKKLRRRRHKLKRHLLVVFPQICVLLDLVVSYLVPSATVLHVIECLGATQYNAFYFSTGFKIQAPRYTCFQLCIPFHKWKWICIARDLLHLYLGVIIENHDDYYNLDILACHDEFCEFVDQSLNLNLNTIFRETKPR